MVEFASKLSLESIINRLYQLEKTKVVKEYLELTTVKSNRLSKRGALKEYMRLIRETGIGLRSKSPYKVEVKKVVT